MENFDAYILENTSDIVIELEKMGFKKSKTFEGKLPYIWVNDDKIFETLNVGIEVPHIGEYFGPYGICCGNKKEMFYALCSAKHLNDNYINYRCYTWEDENDEGIPVIQYIEGEHWEDWWNFEIRESNKQEILKYFTSWKV